MEPMHSFEFMEKEERESEDKHVIAMLMLRPSDEIADSIFSKLNYLHLRSKGTVNIYLPGYGTGRDYDYEDSIEITGPMRVNWYYSDKCFIEVIDKLESRLSTWFYSGEPELMILQNDPEGKGSSLSFRNYYCIELLYGIEKGYIHSFDSFMEQFIRACSKEVTSAKVMSDLKRKSISIKKVLNAFAEGIIEQNFIPESVTDIVKNYQFIHSCRKKD